jgi:hypothetical protein
MCEKMARSALSFFSGCACAFVILKANAATNRDTVAFDAPLIGSRHSEELCRSQRMSFWRSVQR